MTSEEISNIERDIVSKIEELKRERNKTKRNQTIALIENKYLPSLLEKRIQRDMQSVSKAKKEELLSNVREFISLGKEKNYFTDDNILDVLKQLTLGLKTFDVMPRGAIYGQWAGYRGYGSMSIDIALEKNFMRHIVFHELAHCVTPDLGPISPSREKSLFKPTNASGKNGQIIWTRKDGYEFGWNETEIKFLRECMAESMACELDVMYKPQRTPVFSNGADITSDWTVTYNRTYQQLGDEFLQTLPFINTKENDTDRKRFKALTIRALKENNTIAKNIDEVYARKNARTGSKDLESIATKLSKLLNHTSVTKKEVDDLREEMKPYQENPRITIIRRGDTKPPKSENGFEEKRKEILRLFSMLSPEEKVEQYSRLLDIHEEGKRVLNQFVQLPLEEQREFYKKMQEIAKEKEKE